MIKPERDPCETRIGQRSELRRCGALATACLSALAGSAVALAEGSNADTPDSLQADSRIIAQPTSPWSAVWTRDTLLGTIGGLRPALGGLGVTIDINETSELLGNLTGGTSKGYAYDGVTTMVVQLDTRRAFGWDGGTLNVSGLQIHGSNFSTRYLSSLNTASGIEAGSGTRLWELWYQQSFLAKAADIRIGQQSIDQEFMTSLYSASFVNTMSGWPGVPSYDLPAGGPAYPLSDLGVRLRSQLTPALTALFGVYSGSPSGNREDTRGTNFSLSGGTLWIGELQYALNPAAENDMDMGPPSAALPGIYKIGAWYNSGSFADQRYDTNGMPLADQMVWRPDPAKPRALGVFTRIMYAPIDQNLVRASANLGVTLKAPLEGRDADTAGLALAYIKVSDRARGFDQDVANLNPGTFAPLRSSETVLEATYQYRLTPWCMIQADAQYTWNPGGGIVNPDEPTRKIRNEFVLGARTTIDF